MWSFTPWIAFILPKIPDLLRTQSAIAITTIICLWAWACYQKKLLEIPRWWIPFLFMAIILTMGHWWTGYLKDEMRWWTLWGIFPIVLITMWFTVPQKNTGKWVGIAAILMSVHVIAQKLGGQQFMKDLLAPGSVLGNPTNMGVYLCLTLPWVWKHLRKWFIIPVIVAIWISESAVAYICLGAWIFLLSFQLKDWKGACLFLILLFSGGMICSSLDLSFWDFSDKLSLWERLVPIIKHNHLTGVGFGTFRLLDIQTLDRSHLTWGHPWSLPIRVMVEGGLLSIAAVLCSFILVPWKKWFSDFETRCSLVLFVIVCALSLGGSDLTVTLMGTWWMNRGDT